MKRPSITNWNRLEPRTRSDSIERSLEAQVRDPLWFLTRQWQFGEFQGEDAGSPAWVQFKAGFSEFDGWGPTGSELQHYDSKQVQVPLEALIENEPFSPDHATEVELGQRFETLLSQTFDDTFGLPRTPARATELNGIKQAFRDRYKLSTLSDGSNDWDTHAFLRLCAGRAINGIALLAATAANNIPPEPEIVDQAIRNIVQTAVGKWRAWISNVYGELIQTDAITWKPDQLEYGVDVAANTPDGKGYVKFDMHLGRDGGYDWYAFDEKSHEQRNHDKVTVISQSLLPIQVRFRGMPHTRWWQFQDRIADLGEIQPEIREIAKLVLMDFMFVHGNDWFVVPFTQDVGTLCRIENLIVHDVFGGKTLIERASKQEPIDGDVNRWSMFGITAPEAEGGLADYFILPPSAVKTTLNSEVLESVKFIRDEMANMVWAIEHITENGLAIPWLGHERTLPDYIKIKAGEEDAASTKPLRYRIQNSVPGHWIPFVPIQIDVNGEVALEQTTMLTPSGEQIHPTGRILNPEMNPYRVREEEVPRTGVTVSRVVHRSRWINGTTHMWIARRKQPGGGEGSSGLRFDVVHQTNPRKE